MGKQLLKAVADELISIEITQFPKQRKGVLVYAGERGWAHQYTRGESLFQVLNDQVKCVKQRIKDEKRNAKALKKLLQLLLEERTKLSQLTLF